LLLYTRPPLPLTNTIFVSEVPSGIVGNFILPVNEPEYEPITFCVGLLTFVKDIDPLLSEDILVCPNMIDALAVTNNEPDNSIWSILITYMLLLINMQ
jgi:hypothetical protein